MSSTALKQEIHQLLEELPPEDLPEVVEFLDFLHFRASRKTPGRQVKEALSLYTAGEISLGRMAELAGMNYFVLEEMLRNRDFSVMEPEITDEAKKAEQREIADEVLA